MISNIQKLVINELENKIPVHEILDELIVSFCSLSINEIKHADDDMKDIVKNYAADKLDSSFRLIQNYQSVLDEMGMENVSE